MTAQSLQIQFDRSGRTLTVYLSGELDAATAPIMTAKVVDEIPPGTEMVWLDIAEVSFCDSSGIGSFLDLNRHVEEMGGAFKLYQPTEAVDRVLTVTGIKGVIPVAAPPRARSSARDSATGPA